MPVSHIWSQRANWTNLTLVASGTTAPSQQISCRARCTTARLAPPPLLITSNCDSRATSAFLGAGKKVGRSWVGHSELLGLPGCEPPGLLVLDAWLAKDRPPLLAGKPWMLQGREELSAVVQYWLGRFVLGMISWQPLAVAQYL